MAANFDKALYLSNTLNWYLLVSILLPKTDIKHLYANINNNRNTRNIIYSERFEIFKLHACN